MRFTLPRQWIERRFLQWLERRMPAVDSVTLEQRIIFIIPSKAGWFFFCVGMVILVGAANYQNNMGLALAFWLASLGMIGLFISFRNVLGVRLRAGVPAPVYCGEQVAFPVWLDDPEGRAHAMLSLGLIPEQSEEFDVPAQATVLKHIHVNSTKRGTLGLPRFVLQSYAPFGWMRVWSRPRLSASAIVYPKPVKPPFRIEQRTEGDRYQRIQLEGIDDFSGHRRWREGDSQRQINWKAYAKERGLLVKEFSTPASDEQWLRLSDLPSAALELQLSWLCYMVLQAERNGQRYGVQLQEQKIKPAQGDVHLHHCLKALAFFRNEKE